MPAQNGFGPHDGHRLQHPWPQPVQPDEQEPVRYAKAHPSGRRAAQDSELMPKGEVLQTRLVRGLSGASSAPSRVVIIPTIGRDRYMVGTLLTSRFSDRVFGRHSDRGDPVNG